MVKQATIAAELRQMILDGALSKGDSMPTYRELMETHGVAKATVRQALARLQAEGLVESVVGRGTVVASVELPWDMIGLGVIRADGFRVIFEDFEYLQHAFEAQRCDLSLRRVSDSEDDAAVESLLDWAERLSGVILYGQMSDALLARVRRRRLRCVIYGYPIAREFPEGLSLVAPDLPSMMQLAVGYLAGLGHRRILFVTCAEGSWYFSTLNAAFVRCMREGGMEAGARTLMSGAQPERILQALRDPGHEAPTALLVENAAACKHLLEHLAARGVRVPEEVSVMAISESVHADYVPANLTCVLCTMREGLSRAVEVLRRLAHASAPVVHVEKYVGGLRVGTTCASPARS